MVASVVGESHPEAHGELVQFRQMIAVLHFPVLVKGELLHAALVGAVQGCSGEALILGRGGILQAIGLVLILEGDGPGPAEEQLGVLVLAGTRGICEAGAQLVAAAGRPGMRLFEAVGRRTATDGLPGQSQG